MTYGKKVMVIGGVRVTDKKAATEQGAPLCLGCFFWCNGCLEEDAVGFNALEREAFGGNCVERRVIYIPAPDDLKEEA